MSDDLIAQIEELRWIVLRGGLRLPGFDHWRERSSSKPSDPDDVRWDCSCGYAGSPETVERHWAVILRAEPSRSSPDPDLLVEAMTDAIESQNLYHGRHGTTPAGKATAMAILSCLRNHPLLSRLGSSPDLTGLDPERLATVLHARRPGHLLSGACDDCRRDARAIAAEYARLSPAPETDPSQVER